MYFLEEPMTLSAWKTLSVSSVKYVLAFALTLGVLHAETLTGKVIHVADGDTITILDSSYQQLKIRLVGIDAPEKAQACGQSSKEHLNGLVQGQQVIVETSKKDR